MKKIFKILVIEDEDLTADRIEMLIEKIGHEHLDSVDNSQAALRILEDTLPDLILMDINIEGDYDGVELADLIHQKADIPIIFITSLHDERTFRRIKRTNPVGYIVKPFNDVQLQRSIELIIQQLDVPEEEAYDLPEESIGEEEHVFFVKKGASLEKINLLNILYLEADGRYCVIGFHKKKFLVRIPLREMMMKLNPNDFIQVHRSYVVNKNKIESINLEDNIIQLVGMTIPISRREKDRVLEHLRLL